MNGPGDENPVMVRGAPLRLCDGPYAFAEPPDLLILDSTPQRLDFLKGHLQSRCALWAGKQRRFLDIYFAWIAATLASDPARAELAETGDGLFAPADWSFAAWRPLPDALLPAGKDKIRADFACWSGAGFVAIELSSGTPRAGRRVELDALQAAGAAILVLEAADLRDADALGAKLPDPLRRFWRGLALPPSPFGPRGLAIETAR